MIVCVFTFTFMTFFYVPTFTKKNLKSLFKALHCSDFYFKHVFHILNLNIRATCKSQ